MQTLGTPYAWTKWFLVPGSYSGEPGNQFQQVLGNQKEPLGTTWISKKRNPHSAHRSSALPTELAVPTGSREPEGTTGNYWYSETFMPVSAGIKIQEKLSKGQIRTQGKVSRHRDDRGLSCGLGFRVAWLCKTCKVSRAVQTLVRLSASRDQFPGNVVRRPQPTACRPPR